MPLDSHSAIKVTPVRWMGRKIVMLQVLSVLKAMSAYQCTVNVVFRAMRTVIVGKLEAVSRKLVYAHLRVGTTIMSRVMVPD